MAFKYYYHLQLCMLPKLDAGGVSVGGDDSKMAFNSSYHLLPCQLSKLNAGGASVGGYNSNVAFKGTFERLINLGGHLK